MKYASDHLNMKKNIQIWPDKPLSPHVEMVYHKTYSSKSPVKQFPYVWDRNIINEIRAEDEAQRPLYYNLSVMCLHHWT